MKLIQYYLSRDDLPFDEAISNAKEKIGFLSISHIIATQEKFDVMRGAIIRGLEITILLLDSNSSVIPQLQSNFKKSTTDLKNDIETSKKLLNEIKLELPEDKKILRLINTGRPHDNFPIIELSDSLLKINIFYSEVAYMVFRKKE